MQYAMLPIADWAEQMFELNKVKLNICSTVELKWFGGSRRSWPAVRCASPAFASCGPRGSGLSPTPHHTFLEGERELAGAAS